MKMYLTREREKGFLLYTGPWLYQTVPTATSASRTIHNCVVVKGGE